MMVIREGQKAGEVFQGEERLHRKVLPRKLPTQMAAHGQSCTLESDMPRQREPPDKNRCETSGTSNATVVSILPVIFNSGLGFKTQTMEE